MDADRTRLLLKPEEAAEILAVGRTQLYALLASGQLQSVKIGRLRRVPLAACESYVLSLAAELPA
jgi:excisionase family DNA binding protein